MAVDTCTMTGKFVSPDGRPTYRMSAQFQGLYVDGSVLYSDSRMGGVIRYYTDSTGTLTVPLICGVRYSVRFSIDGETSFEFTCPDVESADLLDYVFPYIATIQMKESAYSISVGGTSIMRAVALFSDGQEEDASGACDFIVSDTGIAAVNGGRILTGVAPGVTDVNVDGTSVDETQLPERVTSQGVPFRKYPSPSYVIGAARSVTVV